MQALTLDQIKLQYPNEWVLVATDADATLPIQRGTVLLHSKDYLELCYKASELARAELTTIFFTGERSKTRKWLKATRLSDTPKTI